MAGSSGHEERRRSLGSPSLAYLFPAFPRWAGIHPERRAAGSAAPAETDIVTTISYSDSEYPIRPDFAEAHTRFWERLARPGAWWTGTERIAIAREARAAPRCRLCRAARAALSPVAITGEHERVSELPETAVDAVHRIVTDASRLTRAWYRRRLEAGMSDGHYVELLGVVVALVSVDAFCRAMGLPLPPLPEPVAGDPSGYRPERLATDEGWVPMVPAENAGTPEADLWPPGRTGNVIRAMSLVPDAVRTLEDLSAVHYLANENVRRAGVDRGGALTRSQMELLAGRVSALNQCYY